MNSRTPPKLEQSPKPLQQRENVYLGIYMLWAAAIMYLVSIRMNVGFMSFGDFLRQMNVNFMTNWP